MAFLKKIKKKGIKLVLKIMRSKIMDFINTISFYFFKIFPVDKKGIILESEGDFSDNAYALFDYMKNNGYLKKYRITWLVDNPHNFKDVNYVNTKFVSKKWGVLHLRTMYYLSTCKYYVYDHNCLLSKLTKKREQVVVYLTHGFGYKAQKGATFNDDKTRMDILTVTGEIPAKVLSVWADCDIKKIKRTGYPRNDFFFKDSSELKKETLKKLGFDKFSKVIVWMPTFRKSTSKSIEDDYIKNQTGLPLLETRNQLNKLNEFLKKLNIMLVLKIHPLQAELEVFNESFSNINVMHNEDISQLNLQLYQFVSMTDALITDYSSISSDYMLLDKPIIYILSDYNEYNKSRGIYPSNALNLMVGYHVYSIGQLEKSIIDISKGADFYKESRNKIMPKIHENVDGNASKRILDVLNIKI